MIAESNQFLACSSFSIKAISSSGRNDPSPFRRQWARCPSAGAAPQLRSEPRSPSGSVSDASPPPASVRFHFISVDFL